VHRHLARRRDRAVGAGAGGDGVGVDGEGGGDVLVTVHRHVERVVGAAGVAAPADEVPAEVVGGAELHHGAVVVARLVRVPGDRAVADHRHVQRVGVDGERRRDVLGAVHRHAQRIVRAGSVAAPADEMIVGGGSGGELDGGAVVVGRLV